MVRWITLIGIIAAVTFVLGLLVYASPRRTDQLAGQIIMAYAALMLGTLFLPPVPWVAYLRWAMVAPPILFLAYWWLKGF